MITLSSIPPVALSRDPLPVTFTTNNYLQVEGVSSLVYLRMAFGLPVDGDILNFTLNNGNEYNFVCSTTPNDLGNTFLPSSGESADDYLKNIILPMLQANYYLTRYMRFYHDGTEGRIYIESLNENIYLSEIISTFSAQLVWLTEPVVPVFRSNFKINYEIVDYATDVALSPVESLEPDENGQVTVDICEYLQGLAKNSFNYAPESIVSVFSDDITRVYIRYWESYGTDSPVINQMGLSDSFYVIEAATSWIDQARLNENNQWWYDQRYTNKNFLSNLPTTRNILPEQKLFLKWLHLFVTPGLILRIKTMKTVDGSPVYTNISVNIGSNAAKTIYWLDVSPTTHSIPTDIESYQVWLESGQGVTLSEIRTYVIDRNYYNNIRFYFFRNSLGGFETLHGTGYGSVEESYSRERATMQIPARHTIADRETKVISIDQQLTFKTNLGFINLQGEGRETWANAVRQLYSSFEAYEAINGELFPIDILTDKQKLLEDEEYLPGFFEFEYTRAFVEKGAPSQIPALTGAYSVEYSVAYEGGSELTVDDSELEP